MSANVLSTARNSRAALACNVPCFKQAVVERLRAGLPDDEHLAELGRLFAALGDRTRLRILIALKDGDELCVCDVANVLGLSVSSTSHHLRKLHALRLVKYRNDGKMAYYSLRDRLATDVIEQVLRQAVAG